MRSNIRWPFLLVSIGITICITLAGLVASRELASDCDLSGTVQYNSAGAPVGTKIQAYAGSVVLADTTVKVAGHYEISIPPDDTGTLTVDGWVENVPITIYVDLHPAQPTIMPADGHVQQDIAVLTMSDVKKSTWGKIKALFR